MYICMYVCTYVQNQIKFDLDQSIKIVRVFVNLFFFDIRVKFERDMPTNLRKKLLIFFLNVKSCFGNSKIASKH